MKLMISVVSAEEAVEAISGGAQILDVKNPGEGSLGAQPPATIKKIRALAGRSLQVSAAIGDMPNLPGTAALAALGAAVCGADFIKVGLRGPRSEDEAVTLLGEVRAAVRDFPTSVIAALYADYEGAGTLPPECLPGIAARAGIQGCLLDTAIKDGRSLLDFLDRESLIRLTRQAHDRNLLMSLAGSLRASDLHAVKDVGADIAGMRAAACRGNQRSGPVEAARVLQLHRILVPAV